MLKITNLSVKTPTSTIIKDISFSMECGKILAIVGASGSGKSTLANCIMGLLPSTLTMSGEIEFQHKKDIAIVFQDTLSALNPLHKIGDQIIESYRNRYPKKSRLELRTKTNELLKLVELDHLPEILNSYPHELSGGERQRVVIASAISVDPKLLILDEPTSALDASIRQEILTLFAKLRQEIKCAIILITHDLQSVRQVADRIAVMNSGMIVEIGTSDEIFTSQHDYTKTLLAGFRYKKKLTNHSKALLKVIDLSLVIKNKQILRNISFTLNESRTLAIVGPSGSGKTSLALCILNEQKKYSGIIEFMGSTEFNPEQIQAVLQDPYTSLNPKMTIGKIITEPLKIHKKHDGNAEELLATVGLENKSPKLYPHELSGGERQRVAIARAVAIKPKLIILDEPTSSLDSLAERKIVNLLANLQRDRGISYLLITHNKKLAEEFADQTISLEDYVLNESL